MATLSAGGTAAAVASAASPFCRPEEDPFLLLESTMRSLQEILRRRRGLALRRTWIEHPYGEEEITLLEEEVIPAIQQCLQLRRWARHRLQRHPPMVLLRCVGASHPLQQSPQGLQQLLLPAAHSLSHLLRFSCNETSAFPTSAMNVQLTPLSPKAENLLATTLQGNSICSLEQLRDGEIFVVSPDRQFATWIRTKGDPDWKCTFTQKPPVTGS